MATIETLPIELNIDDLRHQNRYLIQMELLRSLKTVLMVIIGGIVVFALFMMSTIETERTSRNAFSFSILVIIALMYLGYRRLSRWLRRRRRILQHRRYTTPATYHYIIAEDYILECGHRDQVYLLHQLQDYQIKTSGYWLFFSQQTLWIPDACFGNTNDRQTFRERLALWEKLLTSQRQTQSEIPQPTYQQEVVPSGTSLFVTDSYYMDFSDFRRLITHMFFNSLEGRIRNIPVLIFVVPTIFFSLVGIFRGNFENVFAALLSWMPIFAIIFGVVNFPWIITQLRVGRLKASARNNKEVYEAFVGNFVSYCHENGIGTYRLPENPNEEPSSDQTVRPWASLIEVSQKGGDYLLLWNTNIYTIIPRQAFTTSDQRTRFEVILTDRGLLL